MNNPTERKAVKSAQWTAVLVLALMVGGISFVSVYLGGPNRRVSELPPVESLASLSFPVKLFPRDGEKAQTTEVGRSGHQDFWFANESGRDVPVGLNGKGCTCSEVEIVVASANWRPYLLGSAVTPALQLPPHGLENLTTLAAACDRQHLYPELLRGEATATLLTEKNSVVVPAGALGCARLSWRQETVRPLETYADLWMGQRGGEVNARLTVRVLIAAPLEVNKELTLPSVSQRDLETKPEGKRAWIYCWSRTRPHLHLKAKLLSERRAAESDAVEIGEPIPLGSDELRKLETKDRTHQLTALAGYKIPVTVRPKAKDGTPIEWGLFRRLVQLSSADEDLVPVQVKVTGQVLGDITVGSGQGSGAIHLGPFPRKRGTHGEILLHTDEKSIDLELDTSHPSEYLKARLGKPKEAAAGHRSWLLHVEVPPNAARGEFPRSDNPLYRDSAIYVKTKEKKPRSIRIPVVGVANEG